MASERNDFNVNLGDVMYSDSAVPEFPSRSPCPTSGPSTGSTSSYPFLRLIRARAGLYSLWDDHEFIDDFSIPQYGLRCTVREEGVPRLFPRRSTSKYGLYRHFRWGKNLEIFFLDERSFRSSRAESNPACRNPATGQPDPLPQLPARLRSGSDPEPCFANFPTAAQCQAIINDPNRTMLGKHQLAHFRTRSSARRPPSR